ncbi:TetR/AcrR family transcriptional regulator [Prauserella cavernicola]|uniref:TetR/AcrR family transcriptional regulator n=1 Tax=Prauserella cavernicola TaxID=2800127 RepID=A0A934QPN9_9PSEU|nr:TetR/AcrR family transcriptional regulator [Prauserella cavernicola]MBK1783218.1 TetR/AcrR family transcriptional regulator [Prauserella cavernicola]
MGRPSAREQILDAYEDILIDSGSAAVTLDAVAARAAVSKGGLLYHFGSKDALLDGLVDRLRRLTIADVEHARTAPEGVVRYYLLTSVTDASMNKPAHRSAVAALRLLGSEDRVTAAMAEVNEMWANLLAEHFDDPLTAEMVALLGDGLYLRATMGGQRPQPLLDRLPEALARLGAD